MSSERISPGKQIVTLGLECKASLSATTAECRFPARMHVTPIDCNCFSYGKPGGGGVGFAVAMENRAVVAASSKDVIACPDGKQHVLEHVLHVARRVLGTDQGFEVSLEFDPFIEQHAGFGSSAIAMTAVLKCINTMHGSPLSDTSIRRLVGFNFVEQCGDGLARALETGIAPQVVLAGGCCVLGNDLIVLYSGPFLPDHYVALVNSQGARPPFEGPERDSELTDAFSEDAAYRYLKAYMVMMELIPAIHAQDVGIVSRTIWRFQFTGCHLSMISDYTDFGRAIFSTMTSLKEQGAGPIGMSSVGPTVYAFHESQDRLRRACEALGKPYRITRVHNAPLVVAAK